MSKNKLENKKSIDNHGCITVLKFIRYPLGLIFFVVAYESFSESEVSEGILGIIFGLICLYPLISYWLNREVRQRQSGHLAKKINQTIDEALSNNDDPRANLITNIREAYKIRDKSRLIVRLLDQIEELDQRISNQVDTLNLKKKELQNLSDDIEIIESGIYEPRYAFASSTDYKDKLKELRDLQKKMIKDKTSVNYSKNWTVNGSKREGTKMMNGNIRAIMRSFNADSEAAINKITYRNLKTTERRIRTSFRVLNNAFKAQSLSITEEYLDLKIQEMYLAYEFALKKEDEKEELRAERERRREEKALQREIKQKRKKIQKETTHLQKVIENLEGKLTDASEEESIEIKDELAELQENLEKFEDEENELDYRIEHIGAGYVYIISNIGAFGNDVYKIGVTRRLNPYERISELSSASVPFRYDVHAMIFSYDAFELEKELHEKFSDQRVNMVNYRKEFFNITIDDIEEALKKYGELTMEFYREPEANEYYETLTLLQQKEELQEQS